MAYIISKSDKGYQIKSSISNEFYHNKNKFLSEDEMKALLIENKFIDFLESVASIELDFPDAYTINNNRKKTQSFASWRVENNFDHEKFEELVEKTLKRVGIKIDYSNKNEK